MSNDNIACQATGGSGAAYRAYIYIGDPTVFTITTSSGGTARHGNSYVQYNGGDATPFSIKEGETELFKITGGTGAKVSSATYYVGLAGEVAINNLNVFQELLSINGSSGHGGGGSYNNWAGYKNDFPGEAGPVAGHTWGGSGAAVHSWAGGGVGLSYHGYVRLTYHGPTPPTDLNYGEYEAVTAYIKY